MPFVRCYPWLLSLGLALFVGCDGVGIRNPFAKPAPAAKQTVAPPAAAPSPGTKQPNGVAARQAREAEARGTMIRTASMRGGKTSGGGAMEERLDVHDAVSRIGDDLKNTIEYSPALVVWMVDTTQSASALKRGFQEAAAKFYQELGPALAGKAPDQLTSAVVAIGGATPQFLIDNPTSDMAAVSDQIAKLPSDDSGAEPIFAAVDKALDKYGKFQSQNRAVAIVVVTDEAGDDQDMVDAVIAKARPLGVKVHAIGVPAPFGRLSGLMQTAESRRDGKPAIVQGPETRRLQRINIDFNSAGFGSQEIDSGFGPFALNYLCRSTGGAYLIVRSSALGSWPGNANVYGGEYRRKYPPQYISAEEYQQLLAGNKALAALDAVSYLPQGGALSAPATNFRAGDEAALKRNLDSAQRLPARLAPPIDAIYNRLSDAEGDRDKITDPRWRASFDLALGRAAAAKARTDGYNQMLALLKGGRKFENPSHDTWMLEPADSLAEAGSRLEKVRKQAVESLQRVIDENPDSPWAELAKRELETPIGWQWNEA
ncbi:VWA domain-containing protein [Blastopirellula sp. JC732]|uniref:VWA domain-containing protein n=1 Tax=Blastopirellula sediminis TaxID=2894196 RepID=A0A9X1SGJ3_9BACT|nr:vWA domain-containing protein [Blastopirellula sediminis]MCC9606452.1 VWA domain-containing protein [Blastopirellula sediminis]MCC9630250.1 VWA domain-containing protein [Blastopirellula sediminis]